MSVKLIIAVLSITLALVFYTIGVISEKKSRTLTKKHVIIFWTGLIFDTIGTLTMSQIASNGNVDISQNTQILHGITGMIAILLMLIHVVWATFVLYKGDDKMKEIFHRFSIFVWIIWLVPYTIGAIIGMK